MRFTLVLLVDFSLMDFLTFSDNSFKESSSLQITASERIVESKVNSGGNISLTLISCYKITFGTDKNAPKFLDQWAEIKPAF